jgi:hypothetical protein
MEEFNIIGHLYSEVGTQGYNAARIAIEIESDPQRFVENRRKTAKWAAAQSRADYGH